MVQFLAVASTPKNQTRQAILFLPVPNITLIPEQLPENFTLL